MSNPKSHPSYRGTRNNLRKQIAVIEKNLNAALSQVQTNTKDAVDEVVEHIRSESEKICPIDTGELIESLTVGSEESNGVYTAGVGYRADHAVFAHENANRVDSKGRPVDYLYSTTPGTHYKFLERPVAEAEKDIPTIIANKIK